MCLLNSYMYALQTLGRRNTAISLTIRASRLEDICSDTLEMSSVESELAEEIVKARYMFGMLRSLVHIVNIHSLLHYPI